MAANTAAKLFLVDASIYIFRAYFAMPDHWRSQSGVGTGAVYGYGQFLLQLLALRQPVVCCYDESLQQCFRNAIYPDYKANRELPDEDLAYQLAACKNLTQLLGIPSYASPVYEADDLIGSLLLQAKQHPRYARQAIAVITRDKDLGQLLTDAKDFLWHFSNDEKNYAADIRQRFGVYPEQLPDYLALVGDSVDNIPGVPGVGAKTAAALLQAYPSIEEIFANLENLSALPVRGAKSLSDKLETHLEQIAVAKLLATICCDAPLPDAADPFAPRPADLPALREFCQAMGFPQMFAHIQTLLANTATGDQ